MSEFHRKLELDDLLSPLPDDILIRILCFTESYKSAVQCSVLSKRWEDLYKKLPCLYFYEGELCDLPGQEHAASVALEIIRVAIQRHEAHVHTFDLQTSLEMDCWDWCVEHFTNCYVQHLTLDTESTHPQPFNPCILSCTSLVTLNLFYPATDYIPSTEKPFPGYPNLRECSLTLLADSDHLELLSKILSWSHLLQKFRVTLHFVYDAMEVYDKPLTFSSNSLVHLDVDLFFVEKPLQVRVVAPELLEMNLGLYEENMQNVKLFMQEVPKLSEISISGNRKYVSVYFKQSRLPKLFKRISYAKFHGFLNLCKCEIRLFDLTPCANAAYLLNVFLSRNPNLRHLTLFLNFRCFNNDSHEQESCDMPLTFLSQSLLDLDIKVKGTKRQLQIKVVAPQLQNLVLDCTDNKESPEIQLEAPRLCKCEIKLCGLALCGNVAKLLNYLLSKSFILHYLTLSLIFKDCGDQEEKYETPLTFLSQSLLDLDITVKGLNRQLQMKVDACQLQKLILDCEDSEPVYKIQLEVKAPKLLQISVPQWACDALNLQKTGSFETIEGLVHMKENSNHHHYLIYLNFNDSLKEHLSTCSTIFNRSRRLYCVTVLELSHIYTYPIDIWNKLLIYLSSLEALTLTDCIFKSEEMPKDFAITEREILNLKEIKFTNEAYYGSDGEEELLSILLQSSPNLQLLCFALRMKKREYKNDYFALLGKFMTPGDMLAFNESSEEMELKILKGSTYKYSKA